MCGISDKEYADDSGVTQRPFSTVVLRGWLVAGYLTGDHQVRNSLYGHQTGTFGDLGDVIDDILLDAFSNEGASGD